MCNVGKCVCFLLELKMKNRNILIVNLFSDRCSYIKYSAQNILFSTMGSPVMSTRIVQMAEILLHQNGIRRIKTPVMATS